MISRTPANSNSAIVSSHSFSVTFLPESPYNTGGNLLQVL